MAQSAFGAGGMMVMPVERMQRSTRSPAHTFQLEHRAFQIQPFLIAPVLPGETLTQLLLQARVVTDPIKNPIIGWWLEHFVFYVKHRDLDAREELVDMMLNPSWSDDNVDVTATTAWKYTFNGAIDWVQMCLDRVVDTYFRDDDETAATAAGLLDGIPMMHAQMPGWMDSMKLNAAMTAEDVVVIDPTGNDDPALYASQLAQYMRQWELLRAGNLTQQSYEEFLATYGVQVPQEELHMPELLMQAKDWSYPSNTIDPTNGAARSAVSWSVAERRNKRRAFTEPGFIFGVTCARPKTYTNTQLGAMVGGMNNVFSWLPAVLHDDPMTSYRQFSDAAGGGPFQAYGTSGYWIDLKDLFIHGDQFVNFALTQGTPEGLNNVVTGVTTGLERRYVADADVDHLFITPATNQRVRQDGIVSLNISSVLKDTSRGVTG